MPSISCTYCGASVPVTSENAGRRIRCPCGASLTVPLLADAGAIIRNPLAVAGTSQTKPKSRRPFLWAGLSAAGVGLILLCWVALAMIRDKRAATAATAAQEAKARKVKADEDSRAEQFKDRFRVFIDEAYAVASTGGTGLIFYDDKLKDLEARFKQIPDPKSVSHLLAREGIDLAGLAYDLAREALNELKDSGKDLNKVLAADAAAGNAAAVEWARGQASMREVLGRVKRSVKTGVLWKD